MKICFVCHGNICRSPMAEFILKDKLSKMGRNDITVVSRGTSYEEQGNDMHDGSKEMLKRNNIPFNLHRATRVEIEDYDIYDYFICMDNFNMRNILNIINEDPKRKLVKLNEIDVKDPWYTGNFEETYKEINEGIDSFIEKYL